MARHKKELTAKQIKSVEELASLGVTVDQIACHLGIAKQTFYRMQEDNPEIARRYKKGKMIAMTKILSIHYQCCLDPKNTAERIFYLKTQCGMKETQVNENIDNELNIRIHRLPKKGEVK